MSGTRRLAAILAEFPSAVQALGCATTIQTKQRAAPDALPSASVCAGGDFSLGAV